ncbi:MAG: hypothetical protein DRO87_03755 [Candidatus Thorarchaeota archaeon]|nr:MAG: hypothetical protein DRO87_03755 [Candidatus Thorarchaeota archaeon]
MTLSVSVDEEKAVYEVRARGERFSGRKPFSRTMELVQFLRHPITRGVPYQWDGRLVTWNHHEDIDYANLTFLEPLVRRSGFFPNVHQCPHTCRELLTAKRGKRVTMVCRSVHNGFRVTFSGLPKRSQLRSWEGIDLSEDDLGLLTTCTELYDPQCKTVHPVDLDVSGVFEAPVHHAEQYPALYKALIHEAKIRAGVEPDYHEEEEVDEKEEEVEVGSMVAEGDVYRSRGVDVVSVQRNRHVTVCLESDMGDIAEVTVVKDVEALAEVSTYGEAIHEETVEQMVVRALRAYALSDEVLKHVKAEVVRTLHEEGVRFSEE